MVAVGDRIKLSYRFPQHLADDPPNAYFVLLVRAIASIFFRRLMESDADFAIVSTSACSKDTGVLPALVMHLLQDDVYSAKSFSAVRAGSTANDGTFLISGSFMRPGKAA